MKKYALQFVAPSFVGILLFYIWAFTSVFIKSFQKGGVAEWTGLDNYIEVLTNKAFWMSAKNTVIYLVICIGFLLVISLFMAWVLLETLPLNQFMKKGYLIPFVVPASVVVFLWSAYWDVTNMRSMVLMFIWKNLGYYIILWTTALSMIPTESLEAAKIDGANSIQMFFRVAAPQLKTSAYYILLFAIVSGFKSFREIFLIGGEYPSERIYMIQHLLSNWYREMQVGRLSSATVILVLFFIILTLMIHQIGREKDV